MDSYRSQSKHGDWLLLVGGRKGSELIAMPVEKEIDPKTRAGGSGLRFNE